MTTVVNVKTDKYDVYIGRPSIWGNPFPISLGRDECIKKYREWFYKQLENKEFKKKTEQLAGKRLGCYCKPLACHGDVIAEYCNSL